MFACLAWDLSASASAPLCAHLWCKIAVLSPYLVILEDLVLQISESPSLQPSPETPTSNPTPPTEIEDRAPGPSKPGAKGLLVVVVAFVVVIIAVVIVVART